MGEVQNFANQVIANVEKVIIGKRSSIELVLVALLCEGHVLLEDVPGSGKTMLARGHRIMKGKGLVGRAAESNSTVLVSDVSKDPQWLPNPSV